MSKRAEKAALKAYPVKIFGYTIDCKQDWNEEKRKCFQEGYESAEEDFIRNIVHYNNECPKEKKDEYNYYLLLNSDGTINRTEFYLWDEKEMEFYGNRVHHIPILEVNAWISLNELDKYFKGKLECSDK